MTALPDRRPDIVFSWTAKALVVREHAPPAPAIVIAHLAARFLACMAGASAITLGLAFLIGAFR